MIDKGYFDFETIGEVEVTLGTLLGANDQTWKGKLIFNGEENRGELIVQASSVD